MTDGEPGTPSTEAVRQDINRALDDVDGLGLPPLMVAWTRVAIAARKEGIDALRPKDSSEWMRLQVIKNTVCQDINLGPFGWLELDKVQSALLMRELIDVVLNDHDGENDLRQPWREFYRAGCHDRDMPQFALDIIHAECVHPDDELELLELAWTIPEFPLANATRDEWVDAFRRHPWVTDDEDDPSRPTQPLTLWRGATEVNRNGLAWTADRDRAEWFANRFGDALDEPAYVWQVTADPSEMLGRFTGRGENEYVIDVDADRVTRAD